MFESFKPSPRFQTHIIIGIILIAVIFVFPFAFMALIPELGALFFLIFVLANLLWLVPALVLVPVYVRSIVYEFGERELVVRRGIITRSESMVPYRMITNVESKRGPIARALGIGSLKVHTAGYSQQSTAEASLSGLADWEAVRVRLLTLIREHQVDSGTGLAGTAPGVARPDAGAPKAVGVDEAIALLREIRDELRTGRAGDR